MASRISAVALVALALLAGACRPQRPPTLAAATVAEEAAGGTVYLTFDDGPIDATLGVLDVLAAQGVQATFFLNGIHLDGAGGENEGRAAEALSRLLAEGHIIGNHSYDHMLHNCCEQGECGANVCNRIGGWSVGSYRDLRTEVAAFAPRNVTAIRQRLPPRTDFPNDHLERLARLPYTNGWRLPGLRADCPCCTTDDVPPWDPATSCSPSAPSHSARLAAEVADQLAASDFAVFGWDLEWSPSDWGAADPADTLSSAETIAAQVASAMTGCAARTLEPAHSRAADFPCDVPERAGKVILLTHDFLFEDGERGRGATLNLPRLARLLELLKEAGYRLDTLDQYL